jgi:hypothetical protein
MFATELVANAGRECARPTYCRLPARQWSWSRLVRGQLRVCTAARQTLFWLVSVAPSPSVWVDAKPGAVGVRCGHIVRRHRVWRLAFWQAAAAGHRQSLGPVGWAELVPLVNTSSSTVEQAAGDSEIRVQATRHRWLNGPRCTSVGTIALWSAREGHPVRHASRRGQLTRG